MSLGRDGTFSMTDSASSLRRDRPLPLQKQNSWSPDILRHEAWNNRRKNKSLRRCGSVTDDDMDELCACFELGFSFDSPDIDPKLSNTFPALKFYRSINQNYEHIRSSSSSLSDSDSSSLSGESPRPSIVAPGDDPATVKMKLRRWAQLVACSVRQVSSSR